MRKPGSVLPEGVQQVAHKEITSVQLKFAKQSITSPCVKAEYVCMFSTLEHAWLLSGASVADLMLVSRYAWLLLHHCTL